MIESLPKHKRGNVYKLFDRLPGAIFLAVLFFLLFGGAFLPEITAYIIIILNVYFLYKSGSLAILFGISFVRIRNGEATNWMEKLNSLDPEGLADRRSKFIENIEKIESMNYSHRVGGKLEGANNFISKVVERMPKPYHKLIFSIEKYKALKFQRKQLANLKEVKTYYDWKDLQHIIIIPHVREPEHILRATLELLSKQTFPKEQINIVLAAEGRDPEGIEMSKRLAHDYNGIFNNIWVSIHHLTDEEIVGKSSNMKAGGMKAYEEITKMGWDLETTLVTSCDADSKLPEQYFAYVSYEYVKRKDAKYKFFNAAMVFYNNIWRLPFYARIKNSMSTLFATSRLPRTDKLIPFSTYTNSFWIIKEVGFWTPWVTPEDFHLFLKSQFHFGGIVSVIPIYLRIMSDAAEGKSHIDTIKNNYQQERRWAWGISDDGWVLQNIFLRPFRNDFVTIYRGLHSVFDHIMGPILGILLIVGGNIPPLINPRFSSTILGSQLPIVSSTIITASLLFMITIILLDLAFKPRRNTPFYLAIPLQLVEWIFLPVASFALVIIPGVESNTRLFFGKYLDYYVTKKH